jgi:hypothetical protein
MYICISAYKSCRWLLRRAVFFQQISSNPFSNKKAKNVKKIGLQRQREEWERMQAGGNKPANL